MIPGLLALPLFVTNVKAVPLIFLGFILLFSIINPFFEEIFWRGLLHYMPVSSRTKILYSSILFSFSHYFLWGTYWLADPKKLIPTVAVTFIAGILWMWFLVKQRNLLYPILSHSLCDLFNLSVAVFYGLRLATF